MQTITEQRNEAIKKELQRGNGVVPKDWRSGPNMKFIQMAWMAGLLAGPTDTVRNRECFFGHLELTERGQAEVGCLA